MCQTKHENKKKTKRRSEDDRRKTEKTKKMPKRPRRCRPEISELFATEWELAGTRKHTMTEEDEKVGEANVLG